VVSDDDLYRSVPMDKVNVLVVSWHKLHAGFLDEIEAVSSRISVKSGIEQFVAELRKKGTDPIL
jgi:hypothetical protein